MVKPNDLTGRRFNRLLVTGLAYRKRDAAGNSKLHWRCVCDCGNACVVVASNLVSGNSKSCGCRKLAGNGNRTHGQSKTRMYLRYRAMITRCEDKNSHAYERYGARGITVCDRWRNDFTAFLADVGECPPGYTLERIDNDKGYEPDNIRWATSREQANNTARNRLVTVDGMTLTVAQWGRTLGLKHGIIGSRISRGWDPEDAVTRPLTKYESLSAKDTVLKRRTALKRATPRWLTDEQHRSMRELHKLAAKTRKHVDHIMPLQGRLAWGLNVPWNLQISSPAANMSKGNRLPENQLA